MRFKSSLCCWREPLNMCSCGFTFKCMDFTRQREKSPFPISLWIVSPPPFWLISSALGGFQCARLGSFSALIMNPSICLYNAAAPLDRSSSLGLLRGARTLTSLRLIIHFKQSVPTVHPVNDESWSWELSMGFWAANRSFNLNQIRRKLHPPQEQSLPYTSYIQSPPPLLQLTEASRDSGSIEVSRIQHMCMQGCGWKETSHVKKKIPCSWEKTLVVYFKFAVFFFYPNRWQKLSSDPVEIGSHSEVIQAVKAKEKLNIT